MIKFSVDLSTDTTKWCKSIYIADPKFIENKAWFVPINNVMGEGTQTIISLCVEVNLLEVIFFGRTWSKSRKNLLKIMKKKF